MLEGHLKTGTCLIWWQIYVKSPAHAVANVQVRMHPKRDPDPQVNLR